MRSTGRGRVSRLVVAGLIAITTTTIASSVSIGHASTVLRNPQPRTLLPARVRAASNIVTSVAEEIHPQVCAIIGNFGTPTGPVVERCSGVLIAPDLMLTQAHCTDVRPGVLFNEKVTCDSVVSAASNGITYTGIAHPSWSRATYVEQALAGVDNHDIGVLLLDQPIQDVKIARLPKESLLNELYEEAAGGDVPPATVVGYGVTQPGSGNAFLWPGRGIRRSTTGTFAQLQPAYIYFAAEGGIACSGDSGGPAFLAGTGKHGHGIVLGTLTAAFCRTANHAIWYRADTPTALEFLSQFVR